MTEPETPEPGGSPGAFQVDIDCEAYPAIWNMVADTVTENKDSPAYFNYGTTITYGQLDMLSSNFAACLQHQYKLKKGDRVALMLPNTLAHPVCMFGILRAGGIVVNINPLYTTNELKSQLTDSGARIIIALDIFADTLTGISETTAIDQIIFCKLGDIHPPLRGWLINFVARYIKGMKPARDIKADPLSRCLTYQGNLEDPGLTREDIAYLQYTGGTSGTPKAAMLTHGNIIANALQAHACISVAFDLRNPYVITALPLYHIFALTANCFVVIRLGGCSHLVTNPRDMDNFIRQLKKTEMHAITGVDTLFAAMLKHPEFRDINFSKLKLTLAGGMSVKQKTADKWHRLTTSPVIEAYGLTEASPAVTTNPADSKIYSGDIGFPLPNTEVSVRDEDGNETELNNAGELWVRGPQVMKGYWNKPEETADTLTEDGWLKTGDIVIMNREGRIKIVDRKKDLIIISGFNVYPSEIEAILNSHPGIAEAGVTGVKKNDGSEIIKASVVKNHPDLTRDEILDYCRQRLTAYKMPKLVEFREELPKSNVGKVLRRKLV